MNTCTWPSLSAKMKSHWLGLSLSTICCEELKLWFSLKYGNGDNFQIPLWLLPIEPSSFQHVPRQGRCCWTGDLTCSQSWVSQTGMRNGLWMLCAEFWMLRAKAWGMLSAEYRPTLFALCGHCLRLGFKFANVPWVVLAQNYMEKHGGRTYN